MPRPPAPASPATRLPGGRGAGHAAGLGAAAAAAAPEAFAGGASGWVAQLGARIPRWLWLKAFGTTAFMTAFFVAYFALLDAPSGPALAMPLTALDAAIPFVPGFFWAYASLWVYVGLPAALIGRLRPLLGFGLWMGGLCLSGLACFWLWPTTVPPAPRVDLAQHPAFALLQGVDAAGNACPSLHVACAVFAAAWLQRILREVDAPALLRAANLAWFAAIAASTLLIKQHVVWDAVAGLALGGAWAWASLHLRIPARAARAARGQPL
ncbi:phosphatase PAP2 family protein [Piscinibacter sakaiensis]|uniref:phosphatase PAP2 family protein n=1 Tax=Piscinibacter sakaiensis TaxID=1547922 RepID=UPI0018D03FD5|nr:phosphatase PAP2 family protein [Piscinibacter sakaiensis]